jgi:hypothetical protein
MSATQIQTEEAGSTQVASDDLPMSDKLWIRPDAPEGGVAWDLELAGRDMQYVAVAHQFIAGMPYLIAVFQPVAGADPVRLGHAALASIVDDAEVVGAAREIVDRARPRTRSRCQRNSDS